MGLHLSSKTQNVLMIIKMSMILVLVAAFIFSGLYHTSCTKTTAASELLSGNNIYYLALRLKRFHSRMEVTSKP
jgi:hypothetical protein